MDVITFVYSNFFDTELILHSFSEVAKFEYKTICQFCKTYWQLAILVLTRTAQQTKPNTDTFANRADPDETARWNLLQQWICSYSEMDESISEIRGLKGLKVEQVHLAI